MREQDARIAELQGHKVEWRYCQQYPNEYEPEEIEHLFTEEGVQWGNRPEDLKAEIASGRWDIHKEPCIKKNGFYEICPFWTTRIEDAVELLDEMEARGYLLSLTNHFESSDEGTHYIRYHIGALCESGWTVEGNGETREEAISDVWMKWKEYE